MNNFCCELSEGLDLCFVYWKIWWPCSFFIFTGLIITDVMIFLYNLDVSVGGIICLALLSFICFMWNLAFPLVVLEERKKNKTSPSVQEV